MASTTTTTTTRNARMRGGKSAKANATTGTRKATKATRASKVTTKVDPSIVRGGKGKAKATAKAASTKAKAKAPAKAKAASKAAPAKAATTTRQRPGDHGLVPASTGKLPAARTKALLAAPKGDKATGLVYRSMRAQVSGGPVATVDNRKGQLGGKAAKGWLAVCLLTGAWGDYGSRHAAATAMAFPPAHGGASKG